MIRVNARLFAAAALCISTEETRYYLNGVHVTAHHTKGALMVGTDGHRLIAVHDTEGECTKPEIIKLPPALLAACVEWIVDEKDDDWGDPESVRVLGKDRTLRIGDDGRPEIDHELRGLEDCRIDGQFPNWQKVIPTIGDGPRSTPPFDGKYLASFAEAAKLLTESNQHIRIVG